MLGVNNWWSILAFCPRNTVITCLQCAVEGGSRQPARKEGWWRWQWWQWRWWQRWWGQQLQMFGETTNPTYVVSWYHSKIARLWIVESWRTDSASSEIKSTDLRITLVFPVVLVTLQTQRDGPERKPSRTLEPRRLKPSFWVDRLDCAMCVGLGADWWVSQTSSQLCFWSSYCNFFTKRRKESISINQKQHFLTICIHMTSLGEKSL